MHMICVYMKIFYVYVRHGFQTLQIPNSTIQFHNSFHVIRHTVVNFHLFFPNLAIYALRHDAFELESYSRTSRESNHHRQSVSDTRVTPYQLSHEDDCGLEACHCCRCCFLRSYCGFSALADWVEIFDGFAKRLEPFSNMFGCGHL